MRSHGYALELNSEANLVFVRKRRPAWTFVLAVLLFPVGLLALLHTERDEIVFELHDARRGDDDQRERPGAAGDQARAERTRALTISHAGGNHAVNSSSRARAIHSSSSSSGTKRHSMTSSGSGAGSMEISVTSRWSSSFSTRSASSAR